MNANLDSFSFDLNYFITMSFNMKEPRALSQRFGLPIFMENQNVATIRFYLKCLAEYLKFRIWILCCLYDIPLG